MTAAAPLRRLGYDRAFHLHIRKSGGSTVNRTVFWAFGGDESDWTRLTDEKQVDLRSGRVIGWAPRAVVRSGRWDYGFDHLTMSGQRFPARTFLFSTVRDPVDRLASHYRMLLDWRSGIRTHPASERELKNFSDDFVQWATMLKSRDRSSLLWSFDENLSVRRAVRRSRKVHFFLLEDIPDLLELLGCPRSCYSPENVSVTRWNPTAEEVRSVRELIPKECEFHARIVSDRAQRSWFE